MKAIGSRNIKLICIVLALAALPFAWSFRSAKVQWPVEIPELKEARLHGDLHKDFSASTDDAEYKVRLLRHTTEELARIQMSQKIFLMRSLFREEKSPYPGMTSNIVSCPKRFWPKIEEKENETSLYLRIQAAATARNTFGVCADEEFAKRSIYLFVFCKHSGQALRVEGFTARDSSRDWDTWLAAFRCLP